MVTDKKLIVAFLALFLVACDKASETYTVDYLYEHQDVRDQVLNDCKENKQISENCTNAELARSKRFNETSVDKKVQQW